MATDEIDALRTANLELAQALAPTWERRRADIEKVATPVREWMVEHVRPQAGGTLLELAAGMGETGFEAAPRLGDEGTLITSDFSPGMLDGARRRGSELGLTNVEYRVLDAERIDLDDDSVDGVLCRFAYMLVPDPAAALAETRRVLRPGGRLALAVWGDPERNPFFLIVGLSLVQRGHVPPPDPPPAPGPFSLASPERTEGLLRAAGFEDVRTEEVHGHFPAASVDDYLDLIADTAGPMGLALRQLSDEDREGVKTDVEGALGRFATDGGYEIPCVALCAVAS